MRTALLAASIFGIVGCSSHPGGSTESVSGGFVGSGGQPDSGPSPFVGTWSCTETVVEKGASTQTSTSTLVVIAAANGQVIETATGTGGAPVCTLTATTSGASALLFPGPCSVAPGSL